MANSSSSLQQPNFNLTGNQNSNISFGPSASTSMQTSTPAYQPSSGGGLWGALSSVGSTIGNALTSGVQGLNQTAAAGNGLNFLSPSSSSQSYSTQYPTVSQSNTATPVQGGSSLSTYTPQGYTGGNGYSTGGNSYFGVPTAHASTGQLSPQQQQQADLQKYFPSLYNSIYGGNINNQYAGSSVQTQMTPQQQADAGIPVTNHNPGSFYVDGIQNNVTSSATSSVQNNNVSESRYNPPTNTGPNTFAGSGGISDPTGAFKYDQNGNKVFVDSKGNPLSINSTDVNNTNGQGTNPSNPYGNGASNPYASLLQNVYSQIQSQGDNYKNAQNQYNTANQNLLGFQNANADRMATLQGNNNYSEDTQLGAGQIIGNRFANELPAYQGAVSNANQLTQNALTQQDQNYGLLNSLVNASSPKPQFGVLTSPVTGQPVSQNPSGSAFGGGQIQQSQNQGAQYQSNQATMNALNGTGGQGGGMVSNFENSITQSGINSGDVNVLNSFLNALSSNTSGQYPALQNQFDNIIAQYAKVLGPQTINTLLQNAKGSTMSQFLNSLYGQAQSVQQGYYSAGTGQSGGSSGSNSNDPLGLGI